MSIKPLLTSQQAISDQISEQGEAVTTATVTPVNAVAAAVTILATEVARMNNDDTITFDGVTLTKANATDAEAGEFSNVAGIRDCVDELLPAWVTSGTTNATLTAAVKGIFQNGKVAANVILEDTTADFDTGVQGSTATVAAATIAVMANGDTVSFAGSTFTKAAETDAEAGEWANATGLAAAINEALGAEWTAAEGDGAVTVTFDDNTEDMDGMDIVVTLNRATTGGVNGTTGLAKTIVSDSTYLYVAVAANTVNDANWRRVSLGSVY